MFAQINDFHNWPAWNPWATIDPAMKETYEGVVSMDRMVGGQFEKGLARMKSIAEEGPTRHAAWARAGE